MNPYTDAHIITYGDLHAVGSTLECVYPPETHGMNPRGWRLITFEVGEELYPPPAMKRGSEWTIMYRVVDERALTEDEIVYFSVLMADVESEAA